MPRRTDEKGSPEGVSFTNLDQPLFDGSQASKRDLVNYLEGVCERIVPELEGRPLSVIRVHRGQEAFMQKNVPKYTPSWVPTVRFWAESSKRDVSYALCNDRRTLLWFANQRAVEYHPTLVRADHPDRMTHLVLDIDPPDADSFEMAVRAARLVHAALADVGLKGAVKTSGAKGLHIFVPIAGRAARRLGGRHPGHRGAGGGARTRDRHDRLHEGRPRREGVHRRDPGRRGHGGGRLQPTGATRRTGVVSRDLGRPGRHHAGRVHRAHRAGVTSEQGIPGPPRCPIRKP